MNSIIYLFTIPLTTAATVVLVNLLRGKSFEETFEAAVGIGATVGCLMVLIMLAKLAFPGA